MRSVDDLMMHNRYQKEGETKRNISITFYVLTNVSLYVLCELLLQCYIKYPYIHTGIRKV